MTPHETHADLLAEITALREHVASLHRRIGELQAALAQANDQEAATSQILRVISRSPAEIRPVLDTVAESAARLCESFDADIWRRDGDRLVLVAHHGQIPAGPIGEFTLSLGRGTAGGRSVLDERTVQVADMLAEADEFPESTENARRLGFRTILSVPLMREGVALGAIILRRTEVQLFSERQVALLQTFADQAVIAIENVRLFNETKEALEQQTATAEILGVISSSPTDIQPVFAALATSAARLCDASDAAIHRMDGDVLRLGAHGGPIQPDAVLPLEHGTLAGHVVRERRPMQVADMQAEAHVYPVSSEFARQRGFRTILSVPLLRGAEVLGIITIRRTEVRPFTDKQAQLLKTFADQAVIAIENVRLFTALQTSNRELTTALGTQTATSDILRVISQSQTDAQPVFDVIVENACRLCDGVFANAVRFDGALMYNMAQYGFSPEAREMLLRAFPTASLARSMSGRAILNRAVVQSEDMSTDVETTISHQLSRLMGFRAQVSVPMLRDGVPVGAITVARRERGPFPERQVDLLKTFADQAVIAIENVRLFTELQASNRELTTALDKQTATSDILRVISYSQTDVQPVFDAILASAVRLLGAYSGVLTRIAGDQIVLAALTSSDDAGDAATRALFPQPLQSELSKAGQWDKMAAGYAQTIRERAPLNIADAHTDPRWPEAARAYARVRGYRSWVAVPMLRHDGAIGTISVTRREPGGFTDDEIALLQTFADQAVIAIENVRLFKELQTSNRDLTEALDQQTATSEILRAISSSPTDLQPVLNTIAINAVRVCGAYDATVLLREGEFVRRAAHHGPLTSGREDLVPINRSFVSNRTILESKPVHLQDVLAPEGSDFSDSRESAQRVGFRTILSVPLLHEGSAIGALNIRRREVRPFSDPQVTYSRLSPTRPSLL